MAVIHNTVQLWPNGRIPFTINENSKNQHPVESKLILQAVAKFTEQVGKMFVIRKNEPNYVEFSVGSQSESDIGHGPGKQTIYIKIHSNIETILHEMGHRVGLEHENFHPNFPYQNADVRARWEAKNSYLSVEMRNDLYNQDLGKRPHCRATPLGSQWDFNSIMKYDKWTSSVQEAGLPTPQTPRNPGEISTGDVAGIRALYPAIGPGRYALAISIPAHSDKAAIWVNNTWTAIPDLGQWRAYSAISGYIRSWTGIGNVDDAVANYRKFLNLGGDTRVQNLTALENAADEYLNQKGGLWSTLTDRSARKNKVQSLKRIVEAERLLLGVLPI